MNELSNDDWVKNRDISVISNSTIGPHCFERLETSTDFHDVPLACDNHHFLGDPQAHLNIGEAINEDLPEEDMASRSNSHLFWLL